MLSRDQSSLGAPPQRRRHTIRAALLLALALSFASRGVAQAPNRTLEAAIIPISGEINDILRDSLERRIADARAQGVTTIIFEMDTPGGMVTSALDISNMIKRLPGEGVQTVAWVHHQAYSAGALISVACQKIVMSSTSSIGDCAPIMVGPVGGLEELGDTERAKAESPILREFDDSAGRNGYDPLLCRAMVTLGEEIWWLENAASGQRRIVDRRTKDELLAGGDQDPDAPATQPASAWRLVESYVDPVSERERTVRQPVDGDMELLTLSQSDAIVFGFAAGIADSPLDLQSALDLSAAPLMIEQSGWERFATWLNSPLIRGILFGVMLIGAYIEFNSPGLILPGAAAVTALLILLAAPYAAGLADVWTIIVLVLGLALIAVELFILPGFGIAGLLGLALVILALLGTFVDADGAPPWRWPSMPGAMNGLMTGVKVLSLSLLVSMIGILLLAKYLPYVPLLNRMALANPTTVSVTAPTNPIETVAPGDIGEVVTVLRPGGQARFGSSIIEARSEQGFIEPGAKVQAVRNEGMTVVVRAIPDHVA